MQLKATLRGHNVGVTALCSCSTQEQTILISGDQEGTIVLWDLKIFRRLKTFKALCTSRIQALRSLKLSINQKLSNTLVAQSRDNGLYIFSLADDLSKPALTIIRELPSYPSLFSKFDAIPIDNGSHAILAYPSQLGSDLITVRYLIENAETTISGTAMRYSLDETDTKASVFDVRLQTIEADSLDHLFVGYEDGLLCCFSFSRDTVIEMTELGVAGLKIDLRMKIDTHFQDFISAYDLFKRSSNSYVLLCGGPKKEIIKLEYDFENQILNSREKISLPKQGISSIKIRPDGRVCAFAGWDNSLTIMDTVNQTELSRVTHHLDQVQDVLFIQETLIENSHSRTDQSNYADIERCYLCSACLDCTINIFEPTD